MTPAEWLPVLALLVGLGLGAWIAATVVRRSNRLATEAALAAAGADAQARLAAALARLAAREDDGRELQLRLSSAIDDARRAAEAASDERVARARIEAELADERARAGERLADLTRARDELSAHFKALAGDALETNRKRIAEQQHSALDLILKPLGDKLAAFEKKVEETYDKEAQQRFSLKEEVLNLQLATARINEDAINLTRALKGEAKTRGNWGEVVLERVLERSGLRRGVEYVAQPMLKSDEGGTVRPDIVIRLPDDKHIVIDSKVSLLAYDRYHAAADDAERAVHGRAHVDAIREHVKALGAKDYHGRAGIDSPDFVALFMPIEPAFGLATSIDPSIFLDAWDRKVVIVTPSTLLALLTTVQTLWQRDKQTRNAIEIAEQSGALHDQVVLVCESLAVIGKHLDDAHKAFQVSENRLSEGRGNLIGRIRRLRELGAKVKRDLPARLVDRSIDEDRLEADPPARPGAQLSLVAAPGLDDEAEGPDDAPDGEPDASIR